MLTNFHKRWRDLPLAWLDTETTGVVPGVDGVVQLGIARFEPDGGAVTVRSWLVNPGRQIPPEATTIHGITDDLVRDAPTLDDVLRSDEAKALLDGAQSGAYNAPFDRAFMPPGVFDRDWPWFDSLTLVRLVDRFAKGKGRHRLEVTCQRHGVELAVAHDAGADARAAGELFQKLARDNERLLPTALGDALKWFELQRAEEWHRFNDWRARQPPQDAP